MTTRIDQDRAAAKRIADAVTALSFADVPAEVVDTVERCFVDTVGVTLAGATVGAGRIAARVVDRGSGGGGVAPVVGSTVEASIPEAGFATGVAAHTLDFDDVTDAVIGHPSACLVPAILAVAPRAEPTGEAAVAAYVAGFETEAALAAAINPGHYERGWHATSTYGTFGAAAAAASVLDLDATATRHALNLAASLPAGLKRNFGSMGKPMHVGAAVRSGLTATLLAADGFDAADEALEGAGGFLDLYSGASADPGAIRQPGTGAVIEEAGIDVKKYPCCYYTHTAIEVAASLAQDHGVAAADVESVSVTASKGAGDALIHPDPSSGFEARFSMEYTVAAAIVNGDVGPAAFEADHLADPTVDAVRERVTFAVDDELPYPSYESTVSIRTVDGDVHEASAPMPPGYHERPLTEAELREKFESCAAGVLDDAERADLYDRLRSLASADSVADLAAAL